MTQPSTFQLETLRKMLKADGTIRRLHGGFWVSSERLQVNGLPAERSCDVRTVRALEKRGWVERTNTHPEEWRDVRRITEAGRALVESK